MKTFKEFISEAADGKKYIKIVDELAHKHFHGNFYIENIVVDHGRKGMFIEFEGSSKAFSLAVAMSDWKKQMAKLKSDLENKTKKEVEIKNTGKGSSYELIYQVIFKG